VVAVHSREALIILVIVMLAVVGSQLPLLVRMIMASRSAARDETDEVGDSEMDDRVEPEAS
jgi:hypothetical protein